MVSKTLYTRPGSYRCAASSGAASGKYPGASCRILLKILYTRPGSYRCAAPLGRGVGASPGTSCRTSIGILHTRPGPCRCAAPPRARRRPLAGTLRPNRTVLRRTAVVRRRRSHFARSPGASLLAASTPTSTASPSPASSTVARKSFIGRPAGDFEGVTCQLGRPVGRIPTTRQLPLRPPGW